MSSVLRIFAIAALLLGGTAQIASAASCAGGGPEGDLGAQLAFLISCGVTPGSGAKSPGSLGAPQSSSVAGGAAAQLGATPVGIGGTDYVSGLTAQLGAGFEGGRAAGDAQGGSTGSGGQSGGGRGKGSGGGSAAGAGDGGKGGTGGKGGGRGNNGRGNGGGDGSPNGKGDRDR
jgi:hypothetical protein